ncbi:MAG: hypothetical protein MJY61_04785 [Bacteroidales bacterium]|nr:hypothetical protein [Bacteroidales bacterium]
MTDWRFLAEGVMPDEGIVLPIDKPYRWTSADVVRKIKYAAVRRFGKKNLKVGHAGTLDPLATGLLLVCIGPATRRAEALQASAKQYLAEVTFGATTPSYDLEKEIDSFYPLDGVSRESLLEVLPGFVGEQEQVAPLFSAKSVDGVRAYRTARKLLKQARLEGKAFDHSAGDELRTNLINIYGIELEEFTEGADGGSPAGTATFGSSAPAGSATFGTASFGPSMPLTPAGTAIERSVSGLPPEQPAPPCNAPGNGKIHVADISAYSLPTARIRVDCSKGTYIRALARDLGEALGSGAFLSSLRRTRNGGFDICEALSIEDAVALLEA